ncbi:flagellar hook-length control protein FliK [Pontibacterium granulatum]|uniref:flagellar hook-length control protein FliK n=1 Tax=Pontibacterium granulatum TaxID=2036029 RepID=UPI00249A1E0B|nr:flagellar hook-length control protein FliK [Pontibacterium granulatum]MDI3322861.1 flagellar hook-length control protein FliK [Pontibacterium granulatum]
MFPQISTLSLALRESPPETQRTLSQVLNQDTPQDARVLRSTAEPGGNGSARITLEVNGKTVQLLTQQPLQSGSLLKISLTSDGKILLQQAPAASTVTPTPGNPLLQTPAPQQAPSQIQTQPQTQIPAQAKVAAQVISLKASSELIPINKGTTIEGTVIKSTPLTPAPINSGSANPTAPSGATYSRPIPGSMAFQGANSSTPAPAQQPASVPVAPQPPASATVTKVVAQQPAQPAPPAPPSETGNAGTTARQTSPTAQTPTPQTGTVPSQPSAATTRTGTAPPAQSPATLSQTATIPSTPVTTQTSSQAVPSPQGTSLPPTTAPPQAASGTNAPAPAMPAAPSNQATGNATASKPTPVVQAAPPTPTQPQGTTSPAFNIDIRLTSGQSTSLQASTALQPNTQLLISRDAEGQISARIQPQTPNIDSVQREQSAIQDALRNALPNQQPVGEVLAQLQNSAAQTQTAKPEVSGLVRSMLQLFGVRPGTPEAPQALQRNVQSGGMQTEFNLASGKVPEKNDLKSLLRQLQQASTDLPVEQRQRIEQLIQNMQSRITHNQVSSLQQWKEAPDGSFERVIQLDIPIIGNNRTDNLELRISQERGGQSDYELATLWRARLHFDLEEFGAVDAEIKLTGDEQIQVQFWCDEKTTQRHIQKQLQDFGQLLQQKGFAEPELNCYHGHSPNREGDLIQKHLVDIHT